MEQLDRAKWEQRRWELALKSDKPVEAFAEQERHAKAGESGESVDDLPPEEQGWYRAT